MSREITKRSNTSTKGNSVAMRLSLRPEAVPLSFLPISGLSYSPVFGFLLYSLAMANRIE